MSKVFSFSKHKIIASAAFYTLKRKKLIFNLYSTFNRKMGKRKLKRKDATDRFFYSTDFTSGATGVNYE